MKGLRDINNYTSGAAIISLKVVHSAHSKWCARLGDVGVGSDLKCMVQEGGACIM